MSETTPSPESGKDEQASSSGDATSRIGFCQECGRGLTAATLRQVGEGVFCVPCAAQRQASAAWQPVNGAYARGAGVPPPPAPGDPSPAFAGVLGFIPGVGAMYNGQYAKGAMHLIVFVLLVTLADNLNGVFYWLVWGWVFYQVFDAYHTARARRDGLPLPNPFGWNDIGERLGFHRTSPPSSAPGGAPASTFRRTGANWAGYVPPAGYAAPTEPQPATYASYAAAPGQNPYSTPGQNPYTTPSENPYAAPEAEPTPRPAPPYPPPGTQVPYAPTFTGNQSAPPFSPVLTTSGARRFPLGAFWLIGLGLLFLLGNLLPEWRLSARWMVPVLLAALSAWSALRRWEQFRAASAAGLPGCGLAGAMVVPAMLFTVAALLALQAATLLPMHRSWPVLLVVWGGLLLLQRTAPAPSASVQTGPTEPLATPVRSTSGTGSLGL